MIAAAMATIVTYIEGTITFRGRRIVYFIEFIRVIDTPPLL